MPKAGFTVIFRECHIINITMVHWPEYFIA